ncbi:hypothetical protein AB5I41_01510 [Sphingomonas sp. MMS24-JH45]
MTWAEFFDPRLDFTSFTEQDSTRGVDAPRGQFTFANDGQTMTQMLARVPAILASDVEWVLFDPSVGNIGNDTVAVYVQKAQNIPSTCFARAERRSSIRSWSIAA